MPEGPDTYTTPTTPKPHSSAKSRLTDAPEAVRWGQNGAVEPFPIG